MRGGGSGELYGSIWINGQPLRIDDRSISGWWRCESPEDLEKRVRLLYGSEIERAERAAIAAELEESKKIGTMASGRGGA